MAKIVAKTGKNCGVGGLACVPFQFNGPLGLRGRIGTTILEPELRDSLNGFTSLGEGEGVGIV